MNRFDALLDCCCISKAFGRVRVLNEVCLSLAPHEIIGIVGSNGAGKTTLLRIIAGLVAPTSGSVLVAATPRQAERAGFDTAYFAGESSMPPGARAAAWFRLVNGTAMVPADKRRIGTLSRGTRQLIGLRATIEGKAGRIVVLDEPWEGLDPDSARWLTAALQVRRDAGAGVIVSSHRLHDLAGLCNRYGFLSRGALVCLTADELSGERNRTVTADALFEMLDHIRSVGA